MFWISLPMINCSCNIICHIKFIPGWKTNSICCCSWWAVVQCLAGVSSFLFLASSSFQHFAVTFWRAGQDSAPTVCKVAEGGRKRVRCCWVPSRASLQSDPVNPTPRCHDGDHTSLLYLRLRVWVIISCWSSGLVCRIQFRSNHCYLCTSDLQWETVELTKLQMYMYTLT